MNLPVYEIEQDLLDSIKFDEGARVMLHAPTGSGKSTAVPQILLDSLMVEGLIVVVQPRRIAARMLARRVAELRNSKLGEEVGYVVRFDRKMGPKTRIVFVTDGVLEGWLANGSMDDVGAVIFDEFHERRLASDMSLALSLQLQDEYRPKMKLVVMSATLELEGLLDYLGENCRLLEATGRTFPVEIVHRGAQVQGRGVKKNDEVWDRCASAVFELVETGIEGHVLVFLPGVHEIKRTIELLERSTKTRGWQVCPLYSALSPAKQDEAVFSGGARRIIVSTNVAETSLTIDGVVAVVDAGTARSSRYDPLRGVNTLMVEKISRAAAEQRAGRAGRTAPGCCVRLWSEADHGRRAAFELAEVQRTDLSETVLKLKASGVIDVSDFNWLEVPRGELLNFAETLLKNLGATDDAGELTQVGNRMAGLRMHPRFARLLLASVEEGCLSEAIFAAASVQSEGLFLAKGDGKKAFLYPDDSSDFAGEWRAFISAQQMKFDPNRCYQIGISSRAAREIAQSMEAISRQCKSVGMIISAVDFTANGSRFSRAMLRAFSDGLAVAQGKATLSCRLVGGRTGKLDAMSVVGNAALFLATELTEVGAKQVTLHLNRCVTVDMADLEGIFPTQFSHSEGAVYDSNIRRVVRRSVQKFRDLVLSQKDGGVPDADCAAALLAERVAIGELVLKQWNDQVEQWIARLLSLREWMPELELPSFDEEDRALAFEQICQGALGYKDIKDRAVMPALAAWLSAGQKAALDAYAPERIKLSNGQSVKLRYQCGGPPTMAMQVQRLFGVEQTPSVADGRVNVLVHVCAPNQRPWQLTQDLAGFWKSGFLQMKKDLAGRYPKHRWEL